MRSNIQTTSAILMRIGEHFLDTGDRLPGIKTFRTGLGAVHDGVAAVELVSVIQSRQTLLRSLVPRVDNPAVRLKKMMIMGKKVSRPS